MEVLFWSCLAGGILFTLVTVILGDVIGQALGGAFDFLSMDAHPWLQPMTLVGGITAFGGAGILLDAYTGLGTAPVVALALLAGVLIGAGSYFLYVRPMQNTENSTGFSIAGLPGAIAEVLVPIPAAGYGEVLVRVGAGHTNQIAASFDGQPISAGAKVVVVEVRENTLYVSSLDV